MAFNINVKKKDTEAASGTKTNLLGDIRVFALLMVAACIGLIVLIVFGVRSNDEIKNSITEQKKTYQEAQASINNLKALQARSSEFEAQRDAYDTMIPDTQDVHAVMIEMERRAEAGKCTLTNIVFGGDAAIGGDKKNSKGTTTPAASTGSGLVKELQVVMTVRGSYADIMTLCADLVTDEELMRIDGIQMKPTADKEQEAVITLVKFSKK